MNGVKLIENEKVAGNWGIHRIVSGNNRQVDCENITDIFRPITSWCEASVGDRFARLACCIVFSPNPKLQSQ
jgi:hypothetical protein